MCVMSCDRDSVTELTERAAWDAVNAGSWDNPTASILPRFPSESSSALNAVVYAQKEFIDSSLSPTSAFLWRFSGKRPRAPPHEEDESTNELSTSKKYSVRKSKGRQLTFPSSVL